MGERDKDYEEGGILVHTEVSKDFSMKVIGKKNPEEEPPACGDNNRKYKEGSTIWHGMGLKRQTP